MLIRVDGGREGIRAYLETGRKQGQVLHRDSLDERVPLHGDIELMDACIRALHNRGEKYLHLTLSFKEDALPRGVYEAIIERFERFFFAAYRGGEYTYYAEAHLPRLKSYKDRRTGRVIERKPHIHVIIPKVNLYSGRSLNPLGMLYKSCPYVDAFQEAINDEYGLASPKVHRRARLESRETILARRTGTPFGGRGLSVKESLLGAIMERNISSPRQFEKELQKYGHVRVRRGQLGNSYLNLKPYGWEKGINLKEYVFSPAFLQLSIGEKRKVVADADPTYIERLYGAPKAPHPQYASLLSEWQERVALELKYLNSGNANVYTSYQRLPDEEQRSFLQAKARAFYERYGPGAQPTVERDARPALETSRGRRAAHETVGKAANPVHYAVATLIDEETHERVDVRRFMVAVKATVSPAAVLAYAEREHGLARTKYTIVRHADGSARIRCGSRALNVSDFLTKELHLPWPQAYEVLLDLYEQAREPLRVEGAPAPLHAKGPPLQPELRELRGNYSKEKDALYADTRLSSSLRRRELSLLQVRYLAAIEAVLEKAAVDAPPAPEPRPVPTATVTVPQVAAPAVGVPAVGAEPRPPHGARAWRFTPLFSELTPSFFRNGVVEYRRKGHALLCDTGRRVIALDHSEKALVMCLRLAAMKFGRSIRVYGSAAFKEKLVQAAVSARLSITFAEQELEQRREQGMRTTITRKKRAREEEFSR